MARKQQTNKEKVIVPRYDFFISYSGDGAKYADELTKTLLHNGFKIFYDKNEITHSHSIQEKMAIAMRDANALIFIGTPMAFNSPWVEKELEIFYRNSDKERKIYPIIFDNEKLIQADKLRWLRRIVYISEDMSRLDIGPSQTVIEIISSAYFTLINSGNISKLELFGAAPKIKEEYPLNEGKLILVGRGEVGKTSLVNRLVHNDFQGNEAKTQGIKIINWIIQCNTTTIRLNIWDFGGQEIMHATHQFFLTERSLYLLVLNGREGGVDEDAEYWLKLIQTFGGNSPVIIVQNKISQHPFDLNYRGLQIRYPQIRAFIKSDCKDDIGLDKLCSEICQALIAMPEVQMKLSKDWFEVKDHLENMKESFIGYETFKALCSGYGITGETDIEHLSWILHCLGIALNYKDDARLRETSVLKPEWVTAAIYQILNAPSLAERQGELYLNDLKTILSNKDYPPQKHVFIIELMRKFSLCFAFADEMDHYLIPELLGKEEPQEVACFTPSDCLNFEYQYAILPEGLVPKFIVRSHTLSRGQERWRTGVILMHEECKALVKAESGRRRVIIRVKGTDPASRRRLLAIIRYDLDRIHSEFKDRLEVYPKVPLSNYPELSIDYKKLIAFEKQGVAEFPEFIGDKVIAVKVEDLLNGVDFDIQRNISLELILKAKTIFFSYSHKDESLRDELEVHLKLLQRQGVISAWHDRKILPGNEWNKEIDRHLEIADIILLLISADFIASDYCWENEIKLAIERHNAGEAIVIPVALRECDWENAPFEKLQGLPKNLKPIISWENRDAAWTDVAKGIRQVCNGGHKIL